MELVPKEELESYIEGAPKTVVDQRARKVLFFYIFLCKLYNMIYIDSGAVSLYPIVQIARFKRQKAAESKLLEIKERKERRGRSTKAAALSTPVEAGEEEVLDDDGEEEREVCV